MLTGIPALESTDWPKLHHAYGLATDTPAHLRALLTSDAAARQSALLHLRSAIMHQGTPWTATGPTALVVAGLLADPRIDSGDSDSGDSDSGDSVRAELLAFLASVAEVVAECESEEFGVSLEQLEKWAAFALEPFLELEQSEALEEGEEAEEAFELLYGNEEAANALFARAILGCIEAAPVLLSVMIENLSHASPRVRAWAARGATILVKTAALHDFAKDLETRLQTLAREAQTSDERSAQVLALGDLSGDTTPFLRDVSPAVRLCAALAPTLATNPEALDLLLNMVEHHAGQIDGWFVERPPQFVLHPRFSAVARLVQGVKDFDRLADAAIAIVEVTNGSCVDMEWGPLLVAAFPNGQGRTLTQAQRHFLRALVGNAALWEPTFGNASKWFQQAGLPYDRNLVSDLSNQQRL